MINNIAPPNVIPLSINFPSDVDIPKIVKSTHLFDKISHSINHSTELAISKVVDKFTILVSLEIKESIGNLYRNDLANV